MASVFARVVRGVGGGPVDGRQGAGNSVEVLLTRYAKCLDGRQEVPNRRIEDLLREYE
ncbi:hypothetical protein ACF1CG_26170 [Streptomyces sp. NPDC014773]|uniref:hypothetical protein n=1 Tax=Streptomyces sp. NPDC014773 TaxID=3364908 RepID=UPI0037026176